MTISLRRCRFGHLEHIVGQHLGGVPDFRRTVNEPNGNLLKIIVHTLQPGAATHTTASVSHRAVGSATVCVPWIPKPAGPLFSDTNRPHQTPVVPIVCRDRLTQHENPSTRSTGTSALSWAFRDAAAPRGTRSTVRLGFTHRRSAVQSRPRPLDFGGVTPRRKTKRNFAAALRPRSRVRSASTAIQLHLGRGTSQCAKKISDSKRRFRLIWWLREALGCNKTQSISGGDQLGLRAGNTLLPLLADDRGQPDTVLSLKLVT